MSAIISECGKYRYQLTRDTGLLYPDHASLLFIMLNPSTADADKNDPTIRRCIGFAESGGYASLSVVNLYAYRATNPEELLTVPDSVGMKNDEYLLSNLLKHNHAICAWGNKAKEDRVKRFHDISRRTGIKLWCLGVTKSGHPRHPLYVRSNQPLIRWDY